MRLLRPIIGSIKIFASIISNIFLQEIKNSLLSKILLLTKLIILQLSNNIELENKYFLNIIEKTPIPAFSYSASFLNSLLNKEKSNNILLKNCLFLELSDI
jgi:hypothetical protein